MLFNAENYEDLWQWSVKNIGAFWGEVWQYTGMVSSTPYEQVVDESLNPADVPEWFKGARINYAENLLKYDDDHVAIIATGEGHGATKVTYKELREKVRICAAALRASGVVKGDRIVGQCHFPLKRKALWSPQIIAHHHGSVDKIIFRLH